MDSRQRRRESRRGEEGISSRAIREPRAQPEEAAQRTGTSLITPRWQLFAEREEPLSQLARGKARPQARLPRERIGRSSSACLGQSVKIETKDPRLQNVAALRYRSPSRDLKPSFADPPRLLASDERRPKPRSLSRQVRSHANLIAGGDAALGTSGGDDEAELAKRVREQRLANRQFALRTCSGLEHPRVHAALATCPESDHHVAAEGERSGTNPSFVSNVGRNARSSVIDSLWSLTLEKSLFSFAASGAVKFFLRKHRQDTRQCWSGKENQTFLFVHSSSSMIEETRMIEYFIMETRTRETML